MNVLDSELVIGALRKQGYDLTDSPASADECCHRADPK
jgi:tRNA-2-methylthio-N6-dimethylallyladenosine synthase